MISHLLYRFIVPLLFRSRWRTFCGLSADAAIELISRALAELEYQYTVTEDTATKWEHLMLGAEETCTRFEIQSPAAFEFEVLQVSSDPLTGFALEVFMPEARRKEVTSEVCVITISPVVEGTEPAISEVVRRLVALSERPPPWQVDHHVGFRLAVLLRLKVRLLWTYWLDEAWFDQ
jgi:hypothetical protein